jgi:hypothetical protein
MLLPAPGGAALCCGRRGVPRLSKPGQASASGCGPHVACATGVAGGRQPGGPWQHAQCHHHALMTRALHAYRATRTALAWFIMYHKLTPSNIRAQEGLRATVRHACLTTAILHVLQAVLRCCPTGAEAAYTRRTVLTCTACREVPDAQDITLAARSHALAGADCPVLHLTDRCKPEALLVRAPAMHCRGAQAPAALPEALLCPYDNRRIISAGPSHMRHLPDRQKGKCPGAASSHETGGGRTSGWLSEAPFRVRPLRGAAARKPVQLADAGAAAARICLPEQPATSGVSWTSAASAVLHTC